MKTFEQAFWGTGMVGTATMTHVFLEGLGHT
jgi:hypothetical protein